MSEEITVQKAAQLKFNEQGLLPAIIQDINSGQVLMLAYMNQEALEKTLQTGFTWFYSRSRQKLWFKGETSGHQQRVAAIYYDCDQDTLLVQVHQKGVACHLGTFSCFSEPLQKNEKLVPPIGTVLADLEKIILGRQQVLPENSYTTYLFTEGLDKILKKIGEEAAEVIIAAKGGQKNEVIYETADLLYHLLVLLVQQGISLREIAAELEKRK